MVGEIELFFVLGSLFLGISLLGKFLEKIKIPWIFSSIIIGIIFSNLFGFSNLVENGSVQFLSDLGMLFLLFLVGLEIDLRKLSKLSADAFNLMFLSLLFSFFTFTFLLHYLFNINLVVASLISLTFATVGEAILVPILDNFNIMKKESSHLMIASGSLDDVLEVLALVLGVNYILGANQIYVQKIYFASAILLLLTTIFILSKYVIDKIIERVEKVPISIITLTIFFIFIVVGKSAELEAVAALLAGIVVKNMLSEKNFNKNEEQIKLIAYSFFAPIFFFYVGLNIEFVTIYNYVRVIVLLFLIDSLIKIISSILIMRKKYGIKSAIVTGIGLSVRFSTSIILITLFYQNGVIPDSFFNVFIGANMLSIIVVPPLLSILISKWKEEIR